MLHFSAGRDTTAQALSWMMYLIHTNASDKNIARKLREEVDEVMGDSEPTYESTKKMKYAEAWYVFIPVQFKQKGRGYLFLLLDGRLDSPTGLFPCIHTHKTVLTPFVFRFYFRWMVRPCSFNEGMKTRHTNIAYNTAAAARL